MQLNVACALLCQQPQLIMTIDQGGFVGTSLDIDYGHEMDISTSAGFACARCSFRTCTTQLYKCSVQMCDQHGHD